MGAVSPSGPRPRGHEGSQSQAGSRVAGKRPRWIAKHAMQRK